MPSNDSAEPQPLPPELVAADLGFRRRRQQQLRREPRRWPAAAAAGLLLAAVLGARFGGDPVSDRIGPAAEATLAKGPPADRGGSQCVGWPVELTISSVPTQVPADRVLVYLSQRGWHVVFGEDLVRQGATAILAAEAGALRVHDSWDGPMEVEAGDADLAVLRPTGFIAPSARPVLTTRCDATELSLLVADAAGRPLPQEDVIVFASGASPGANPATFERPLR